MIPINNLRFNEDLNTSLGKEIRVFPFKLVNGITNLTNNGERDWRAIVNDYNTFQMVLNGKENVIAIWEDSTIARKKTDNWELGFDKEYKVGKFYKGYVLSNLSGLDIMPVPGDEQFTALEHRQSFSILFNEDSLEINESNNEIWNVNNQDLYNLFIIPELGNFQWLKISNVNKYYDLKGVLKQVEINFDSIGTELSTTGGVKRQFINFSSPGEGYAFPKVVDKKVELDNVRIIDTPITSIQVRTDGGNGFHSVWAMGRPVFKNTITEITPDGIVFGKVLPSRRLIPEKVLGNVPNKVSLVGTATEDYYFVHNSQPVLGEIYTDWKKVIGDTYNAGQTGAFEGGFRIGGQDNVAIIQKTNPTTGEGKFPNSQRGNPTITINQTYEIGTSGLLDLTDDKVFKLAGEYTYATVLTHMGFVGDEMIRIPNSIRNNTVWSLSRIPLIGGFLNEVVLGADFGWNQIDTILPTPPIGFFFPCEYLELAKLEGFASENTIVAELFKFGVETSLTQLAGIGNLVCSWRCRLTDLFDDKGTTRETIYLGQKKNGLGEDINVKWNKNCKPIDKNTGRQANPCLGYIIDYINIKMLYEGDYTITFFNDNVTTENEPIPISEWRFSSKAKNTNCIREWNNGFKLSAWIEGFTTEGDFNYPEIIVLPPPSASVIRNDLILTDSTTPLGAFNNINFDWLEGETIPKLPDGKVVFAPTSNVETRGSNWNVAKDMNIPNATIEIDATGTDITGYGWKTYFSQKVSTGNLLDIANSVIIPAEQKKTFEELLNDFKRVELIFKVRPKSGSFRLRDTISIKNQEYISYVVTTQDLLNNNWNLEDKYLTQLNTNSRFMRLFIAVVVPQAIHCGVAHNIKITKIEFNRSNNSIIFESESVNIAADRTTSGGISGQYHNQQFNFEVYLDTIKLLKT